MQQKFKCPVCDFQLDFQPWDSDLASFEICPNCKIHFGYDDATKDLEIRKKIYADWKTKLDLGKSK